MPTEPQMRQAALEKLKDASESLRELARAFVITKVSLDGVNSILREADILLRELDRRGAERRRRAYQKTTYRSAKRVVECDYSISLKSSPRRVIPKRRNS